MLTVRFPQLHHSFQRDGQRGRSEYSNVSMLVLLLHPFTRSNMCTASLSGVVLRVLGGGGGGKTKQSLHWLQGHFHFQ